ncbi:AraC family transcriptional regulator [Siphonobacter sp.]|uniref:helix-turn-helix transcriptional regulator n=1 Tax=Siphonobacter sp. TaxID=1869184 RepID=UPI003B3A6932
MKPLLFRVPSVDQRSFRIQVDDGSAFYAQLHFHPEVQLTLIERGEGTLIVGDRIDHFQPYDVLLLGSNLPHVLRSIPPGGQEQDRVTSTNLFFLTDAIEQHWMQFPEVMHLQQLLHEAKYGVRLRCQEDNALLEEFRNLPQQRPFHQFLFLLKILDKLVNDEGREILSRTSYGRPSRPNDHFRLERVFSFLLQNYASPIALEDVANVANLTPGAFCRFFRQHTRKTFSHLLNEIRIENACRLLRESNEPMSQIAESCGYTNMSNFNRQFKQIVGMPPSQYVRTYRM